MSTAPAPPCRVQTHRESSRRAGVTIVEVMAVMGCLLVLIVVVQILLPRRLRCGEISVRLVCASNLKGIGTSCQIYANENAGKWPMFPFDESTRSSFEYRVPVGTDRGVESISGPGATRSASLTRVLWMLVRSGDATVRQFLCPISRDEPDSTERIEDYFDFTSYKNVSYGYRVPFGAGGTEMRQGADSRMVVAADKGPYIDPTVAAPPASLTSKSSLAEWQPFNSRNHRGEGQNCLFADGHLSFQRIPIVGPGEDNIYTAYADQTSDSVQRRTNSPWHGAAYPRGGTIGGAWLTTDSLIFP